MQQADVISDIFGALRVSRADFGERTRTPSDGSEEHGSLGQVSVCLAKEGELCIKVPSGNRAVLGAGDFVLVPKGVATLSLNGTSSDPEDIGERFWIGEPGKKAGADHACFVWGDCWFDRELDHPLIAKLPDIMVWTVDMQRQNPAVEAAISLLALEQSASNQGQEGVLARLVEILFIQTMRLASTPEGRLATGYISALADPQLFHALLAIHKRSEINWTVAALANEAGMSRASFAQRFTDLVGEAPIAYLTRWRLMRARRLMQDTTLSMSEIASRCGYASVASFTRRFSQSFGMGPGEFRRDRRSKVR